MHIVSLALGGCIKGPPIAFGLTKDTGGHISYVLGAAGGLANRQEVTRVSIVTRLFDDPVLGADYARPVEPVGPKVAIHRVDSGDRRYLTKVDSGADAEAFTAAFIAWLRALPTRPACVHAHFADAAAVAIRVEAALGIPFIYTPHSLGDDKARLNVGTCPGMTARLAAEDRALGAAAAVVASSRDECERQIMAYPSARPEAVHHITPGASFDAIEPQTSARALALLAPFLRDSNKPLVLAIARPVAKKNLAGLVELFGTHPTLRHTTNLAIVAGLRTGPDDGDEEQQDVIASLLSGIDRHDLYGSVAIPKQHDRLDVLSLYHMAHETGGAFVNPAFVEPFGLTLTEAAYHGVPVVATDRGGPADIVARLGHGVVGDPSDHRAFGDAIAELIGDKDRWRAASINGRRRAAAMSWDAYAESFIDTVRSIQVPAIAARPRARPRRLLLCDIDNTLTGCTQAAARFASFIRRSPDLAFGVATGRSLQDARHVLKHWGLPDPVVFATSVGTEIYWLNGLRLAADTRYRHAIGDNWQLDAIDRVLAAVPGYEPQPDVEQRAFKRSGFFEDAAVPIAVEAALRTAGIAARVVASHARMIDVIPVRAGKAAAMRWAADALDLTPADVIVAGDSGNDLDMLDACANAILVGNHCDDMGRRVGEHVVRSAAIYADGVLEAIASGAFDTDAAKAAA